MRSPQDRYEVARSGVRGPTSGPANTLILGVLDEMAKCEALHVGPSPLSLHGESVYALKGREWRLWEAMIIVVSAAAKLERVSARMRQIRIELEHCAILKEVKR